MDKRAFIIHAWGARPDADWIPWAKTSLEKLDYRVFAPFMPDTEKPQINSWVDTLKKMADPVNQSDIFIGHSVGNQTIWRFLESLSAEKIVDKVIMVAPWIKLTNLENKESWKIADSWTNTTINFDQVKSKAKKFVAIFSDNDPFVPLAENKAFIEEYLNAEIIVQNQKGHFTADDGVSQLPAILEN